MSDMNVNKFIRAILTADTEEVVKMLDEHPELAVQGFLRSDVVDISEELIQSGPGTLSYGGSTSCVHRACYDASDGFRYKPGYVAEDLNKGRWHGDDIPLMVNYGQGSTNKDDVLLPIQLCWVPSHKEIVKKLLSCGADINDTGGNQVLEYIGNVYNNTLLYNTINRFPSSGICSSGLREYAEYIKWLISRGASMSMPIILSSSNNIWGTLYDMFYSRVLKAYVLAAAQDYLIPGGDEAQDERTAACLDIIEDLSKFLYGDIDKSQYIPYDSYAGDGRFLQDYPRWTNTLPFCSVNIVNLALDSSGILSAFEVSLATRERNGRTIPADTAERLLDMILYPVDTVLRLFTDNELRYVCQKEDWYRTLTYSVTKQKGAGDGWLALWNTLNEYIPAKEVLTGVMPVADCLRAMQNVGQDDTVGKIEAYERVLGGDMILNEGEKRLIWPLLAYSAGYRFRYYAGLDLVDPKVVKENTLDVIESLCGIAYKYAGSAGEVNPITGQTPAHILSQYIYQAYKDKRPVNAEEKDEFRRQTIKTVAAYLDMFKRYGADLTVPDKNGKTPIEAFPKNMRMGIAKCLQQMDYERSALIEDSEIYAR